MILRRKMSWAWEILYHQKKPQTVQIKFTISCVTETSPLLIICVFLSIFFFRRATLSIMHINIIYKIKFSNMADHSSLWYMNILEHDTPVWLSLTLSHRCSSWTAYTRSRAIVCWNQWNSWTPHSPLDPRSAGRGASRWTRKGLSSWSREKCLLPLDPYPRSNSSRCHRYLFRKKCTFQ